MATHHATKCRQSGGLRGTQRESLGRVITLRALEADVGDGSRHARASGGSAFGERASFTRLRPRSRGAGRGHSARGWLARRARLGNRSRRRGTQISRRRSFPEASAHAAAFLRDRPVVVVSSGAAHRRLVALRRLRRGEAHAMVARRLCAEVSDAKKPRHPHARGVSRSNSSRERSSARTLPRHTVRCKGSPGRRS